MRGIENAVLVYLLVLSHATLYCSLLEIDARKVPPICFKVLSIAALACACLMVCDNIIFYIVGAQIHGRMYARRVTFLVALVYNVVILAAVLVYRRHRIIGMYFVSIVC